MLDERFALVLCGDESPQNFQVLLLAVLRAGRMLPKKAGSWMTPLIPSRERGGTPARRPHRLDSAVHYRKPPARRGSPGRPSGGGKFPTRSSPADSRPRRPHPGKGYGPVAGPPVRRYCTDNVKIKFIQQRPDYGRRHNDPHSLTVWWVSHLTLRIRRPGNEVTEPAAVELVEVAHNLGSRSQDYLNRCRRGNNSGKP